MDSRRLTLYIQGWLGWVEDAIHVVIDQFLFGDGKVSDYLGYEFPPEFPQDERITRIKDERRTLLFRIRHMFRALAGIAKHRLFQGLSPHGSIYILPCRTSMRT